MWNAVDSTLDPQLTEMFNTAQIRPSTADSDLHVYQGPFVAGSVLSRSTKYLFYSKLFSGELSGRHY